MLLKLHPNEETSIKTECVTLELDKWILKFTWKSEL